MSEREPTSRRPCPARTSISRAGGWDRPGRERRDARAFGPAAHAPEQPPRRPAIPSRPRATRRTAHRPLPSGPREEPMSELAVITIRADTYEVTEIPVGYAVIVIDESGEDGPVAVRYTDSGSEEGERVDPGIQPEDETTEIVVALDPDLDPTVTHTPAGVDVRFD